MKVKIDNIKAVRHLEFDMPDGEGGVWVMTGANGAGKSTVLLAMSGLTGAKVALEPTRGEEVGTVTGGGKTMRFAKRSSVSGELQVPTLSGKLNIAELVDPPVKDAKARTKARVRALARIGGKPITPEDLIPEKFQPLVDLEGLRDIEDPVDMADSAKRSMEQAAIAAEKQAEVDAQMSQAKRVEAGDISELRAASKPDGLAEAYQKASQAVAKAEQERAVYKEIKESNDKVLTEIEELKTSYGGPTVDEVAELTKDKESIEKMIRGLEARIAEAKAELVEVDAKIASSQSYTTAMKKLTNKIREVTFHVPTDEELAILQENSERAYKSLVGVQDIERRRAAVRVASQLSEKAAAGTEVALEIRDAVKDIGNKIQECIPDGPISIGEDGQLVAYCDRQEQLMPFDELSEGQRWEIALTYALNVVGEGGLVPVDQGAWQALDQASRDTIVRFAVQCKVRVITGEVGEGDLHVERFA